MTIPPSESVRSSAATGIERRTGFRSRLIHGNVLRYGMSFLFLSATFLALLYYYGPGSLAHRFNEAATQTVRAGIVYCLLALGAGLVIATSEIDLSSLGVATLSGIIYALISTRFASPASLVSVVLASLGALTFCVISGLLVSVGITRLHAPPLIFTWALGSSYALLAILLTPLSPKAVVHTVASIEIGWQIPPSSWRLGGAAFYAALLLILAIVVLVSGLNIQMQACAVGGNADSARYAGLPKASILSRCLLTNAVLSGIAGIIAALTYGAALTSDLDISVNGLVPVAIAIMGGTALSGGYLSLWSIVWAAFFWASVSQLGYILPSKLGALSVFRDLQAEFGNGIFYVGFIIVAIIFGRALTPPASKIYAPKEV